MKLPEVLEALTVLQFTIEELQKDITMQLSAVEATRRQLEKAVRQAERIGEWIALPTVITNRPKEA
jgi:hypothetical protein